MRDLEEDRDHLLRSLEDLDRERAAGDLDEPDYLVLRDHYTARAADVLRALDARAGGAPPADRDLPGPSIRNPDAGPARVGGAERRGRRWRPALVVVTLLAFAAGSGALVARSAGQRLPGDPATGAIAPSGPSAGVARDLARARDLIGDGRTLDAIKVYDTVIDRDPRQPEALAYRGWLLRLAGRASGRPQLIDKGLEYIDRAVAADPSYPDARFFRGLILYQDRRDPAAAVPELRAFMANDPPSEMVPVVDDLLRRALADLDARGAPSDAPSGAPPSTGAGAGG